MLPPIAEKVIAEERTVWELARVTLRRHLFADWATFEAHAATSLATYEALRG